MTHIKIFTLPFNPQLGVFDDEELNNFTKDKELISVSDYFFQRNETFYLTLVVKYRQTAPFAVSTLREKIQERSPGNEEWRKLLNDESMPLFNTLRQWRSEKSKKEGVPPYIILNNKQLAEVCRKRPQSKYDLMKIDGIGKAKVEKYGDDILKVTLYEGATPKANEPSLQ